MNVTINVEHYGENGQDFFYAVWGDTKDLSIRGCPCGEGRTELEAIRDLIEHTEVHEPYEGSDR